MHDANGTVLRKGDRVCIPAVIRDLHPGADCCNVTVESSIGRRPDGAKEVITLNTGVMVLADNSTKEPRVEERPIATEDSARRSEPY